MVITNTALSAGEIELLKSMIGKRLVSYDAKHCGGPDAWSTVRLHFDGGDLDIVSTLEVIKENDDGVHDEFSVLRVYEAGSERLPLPEISDDAAVHPIDTVVKGITVVNDNLKYHMNDVQESDITYSQAIAVDLGNKTLCFDKETWFSEIIFIKEGSSVEQLIFNDIDNLKPDPIEQPGQEIDYSMEFVDLK